MAAQLSTSKLLYPCESGVTDLDNAWQFETPYTEL